MATYKINIEEVNDDGAGTITKTRKSSEDVEYMPIPRKTTAEISGLDGMSGGAVVYDTDLSKCFCRVGSDWVEFTYSTGTHSTNWIGALSSTAGNVSWKIQGNQIVLNWPDVSGSTSTSGGTITMETVLPASLRPAQRKYVPVRSVNDSTMDWGMMWINTDGSVVIYSTPAGGGFTTTGAVTVGFNSGSTTYLV